MVVSTVVVDGRVKPAELVNFKLARLVRLRTVREERMRILQDTYSNGRVKDSNLVHPVDVARQVNHVDVDEELVVDESRAKIQ